MGPVLGKETEVVGWLFLNVTKVTLIKQLDGA